MSDQGHSGGKATPVQSAVWIKGSLTWAYSGVQEEIFIIILTGTYPSYTQTKVGFRSAAHWHSALIATV